MKKVISLGVILTILIVSCGDDVPTESTVKLPSYEMIRSEFTSSQAIPSASSMSSSSASLGQNLIVSFFGISDNQHYFSRHINSNNPQAEITLPNGNWVIYGIVYSFVTKGDSTLQSSKIKCFHHVVSLEGIDKQLDLSTSSEKCQNIASFRSASYSEPVPKITFSRTDNSGNEYRDLAINVQALNVCPQSLNESISVISRLSLPVLKLREDDAVVIAKCQVLDLDYPPYMFLPAQALWYSAPNPLPAWYEVTGYLDTECGHKYGNDTSKIFFNRASGESNNILGSFFSVSGNQETEANTLMWTPEKIGQDQYGCKDKKLCLGISLFGWSVYTYQL